MFVILSKMDVPAYLDVHFFSPLSLHRWREGGRERERDRERHRETWRDIERHGETWRERDRWMDGYGWREGERERGREGGRDTCGSLCRYLTHVVTMANSIQDRSAFK